MTCSCWSRAWKGFLSQPAVLEDHDLICPEGPDPKGTGMALPRFQFKDFPDLGMNSLPCHWQWRWLLDIAVVEKCALLKWFKYFNYLKIFPFSLCSSAFLLHLWNIAFTFQFVHYYPKSSPRCSTTGSLCSEMLVFWLILHWQVDLYSDGTENDQHWIPALLPFPVPSKNKQLCLKSTPGEMTAATKAALCTAFLLGKDFIGVTVVPVTNTSPIVVFSALWTEQGELCCFGFIESSLGFCCSAFCSCWAQRCSEAPTFSG